MSSYTKNIFPRWMDNSLKRDDIMALRRELLRNARGEILEIGFGTGLNLPCYPETVHTIHAVDPLENDLGRERARSARIQVDFHPASAEKLPFPDASFDTVVSTWTLCSIPNPLQSLREVKRVLKPGGQFLFLEHGKNPAGIIYFQQKLLNPFYVLLANGCHLDRDIPALIANSGLTIRQMRCLRLQNAPVVENYLFLGSAE